MFFVYLLFIFDIALDISWTANGQLEQVWRQLIGTVPDSRKGAPITHARQYDSTTVRQYDSTRQCPTVPDSARQRPDSLGQEHRSPSVPTHTTVADSGRQRPTEADSEGRQ